MNTATQLAMMTAVIAGSQNQSVGSHAPPDAVAVAILVVILGLYAAAILLLMWFLWRQSR